MHRGTFYERVYLSLILAGSLWETLDGEGLCFSLGLNQKNG